jgi:hypothetical protein
LRAGTSTSSPSECVACTATGASSGKRNGEEGRHVADTTPRSDGRNFPPATSIHFADRKLNVPCRPPWARFSPLRYGQGPIPLSGHVSYSTDTSHAGARAFPPLFVGCLPSTTGMADATGACGQASYKSKHEATIPKLVRLSAYGPLRDAPILANKRFCVTPLSHMRSAGVRKRRAGPGKLLDRQHRDPLLLNTHTSTAAVATSSRAAPCMLLPQARPIPQASEEPAG